MKPELKDLLKGPFHLHGWGIYNSEDELLFKVTLVHGKEVDGKTCNAAFGYLMDALNEKFLIEGDAEPKRWELIPNEVIDGKEYLGYHLGCPDCKEPARLSQANFCPNCGARLMPGEEL